MRIDRAGDNKVEQNSSCSWEESSDFTLSRAFRVGCPSFRRTVRDSGRFYGGCTFIKRRNQPASENLKSEVAIVVGMARAAFPENQNIWQVLQDDYSLIRRKIEAVLPELFEDYNEKITQPGGFRLYNSAAARKWNTKTGKARSSLNHYQFSKCQLAN